MPALVSQEAAEGFNKISGCFFFLDRPCSRADAQWSLLPNSWPKVYGLKSLISRQYSNLDPNEPYSDTQVRISAEILTRCYVKVYHVFFHGITHRKLSLTKKSIIVHIN